MACLSLNRLSLILATLTVFHLMTTAHSEDDNEASNSRNKRLLETEDLKSEESRHSNGYGRDLGGPTYSSSAGYNSYNDRPYYGGGYTYGNGYNSYNDRYPNRYGTSGYGGYGGSYGGGYGVNRYDRYDNRYGNRYDGYSYGAGYGYDNRRPYNDYGSYNSGGYGGYRNGFDGGSGYNRYGYGGYGDSYSGGFMNRMGYYTPSRTYYG